MCVLKLTITRDNTDIQAQPQGLAQPFSVTSPPQRLLRASRLVLSLSSLLFGWQLRFVCSVLLLFVANTAYAQRTDTAQKLGDPIAYCLSTLAECTPDNQKTFEGKVPGDLRAVNGGTQDPVTLVYQLPKRTSDGDYAVMFASRYTNYCVRFDVTAPTICTERQLTQIALPTNAKHLLSQAQQISPVATGDALVILVVDDEPVNRMALEAQLGALGHEYVGAADGFQALEWITKNGPPDIILLDVMMPGMSG